MATTRRSRVAKSKRFFTFGKGKRLTEIRFKGRTVGLILTNLKGYFLDEVKKHA